ncbi:MAG: crossover junction endodeoxyribonuclease RuvC [Acidimicrobiia bacterium]
MFVLGIDPGLTRTGYGLVRRGRVLEAVAAGVIRTDPEQSMASRLLELERDLSGVIAEHQPEVVAIERIFTNKNRQTAISVGRASGVAMVVAARAGLEVAEYSPNEVKLAVAGDGSATKAGVASMVARRLALGALAGPADVTDALAIAICHIQSIRLPARAPR